MIDYIAILTTYLREHGDIRAVRVSSAQASGSAKEYSYWGAVRYVVTLTLREGEPSIQSRERASSDRRSERLADLDACDIADREGRIRVYRIGRPSQADARLILEQALPAVPRIADACGETSASIGGAA